MDSLYCLPPIEPFCRPQDDVPRPPQTLYTILKEDQERLKPYLPPRRTKFLRERSDTQHLETEVRRYYITPATDEPWEILNAFSKRLRKETDPNTLWINDVSEIKENLLWNQTLTPEQVVTYRKDPAVADIFIGNPRDVLHDEILAVTKKASLVQPHVSQPLPHVTLTYAQSLDSQISLRPGQRTTLSGIETKAMTQFLRANHDAILIGAGTANADNPGLNTNFSYDGEKIVGLAEQPRPLILDPGRSWEEERCAKMFGYAGMGLGRAPWWIVCQDHPQVSNEEDYSKFQRDKERRRKIREFGGDVIKGGEYRNREDGVEWEEILKAMWETGIRSVMIEGGATVINDLLRERNQHLVSSVIVTIAPTYLGSGGVVVAPPRSVQDENEARLCEVTWIPFGQDVVMAGRLESKL